MLYRRTTESYITITSKASHFKSVEDKSFITHANEGNNNFVSDHQLTINTSEDIKQTKSIKNIKVRAKIDIQILYYYSIYIHLAKVVAN